METNLLIDQIKLFITHIFVPEEPDEHLFKFMLFIQMIRKILFQLKNKVPPTTIEMSITTKR